jgi:hypothetical protein
MGILWWVVLIQFEREKSLFCRLVLMIFLVVIVGFYQLGGRNQQDKSTPISMVICFK